MIFKWVKIRKKIEKFLYYLDGGEIKTIIVRKCLMLIQN